MGSTIQRYTDIEDNIFWERDALKYDSFVHFAGADKLAKFSKFRATMIYTKIDKFWDKNIHSLKSKGLV